MREWASAHTQGGRTEPTRTTRPRKPMPREQRAGPYRTAVAADAGVPRGHPRDERIKMKRDRTPPIPYYCNVLSIYRPYYCNILSICRPREACAVREAEGSNTRAVCCCTWKPEMRAATCLVEDTLPLLRRRARTK